LAFIEFLKKILPDNEGISILSIGAGIVVFHAANANAIQKLRPETFGQMDSNPGIQQLRKNIRFFR
jgi:hypothetical protein